MRIYLLYTHKETEETAERRIVMSETFSQEEVAKIFHITRLFLDGHTKISVGRNLAMTQTELAALLCKIERWEDRKY